MRSRYYSEVKETALQIKVCAAFAGIFFFALTIPVFGQSQALDGQIEGTVLNQTGAAVSSAVVTATNVDTGASRIAQTDETGVYRFPLLPLGAYRIAAEVENFKKFVREGIILKSGQTATVDIRLETGDLREVVTVSADASVADAGKTDLGRVINSRDVRNLPLSQRNPYNFAVLQTNVNGRPLRGFNNANVNVNGYLQRINYLLDGNWATQADRPGVRLLFISETYVNEVQLVTNGFAAEFGNTPGMIFNVTTPSGTNKLNGSVGAQFSVSQFYARPFFYNSPDDLPENNFTNMTATLGGAFVRDRWHFYFGFESFRKDDIIGANRRITISPAARAQLIEAGLPASIFPPFIPTRIERDFYIFRTDLQLNGNNRLTGRYNRSPHIAYNMGTGGLNTLERNADNYSPDQSFGAQLVSYTSGVLNELRFQHAERLQKIQRNELSGSTPAVTITRVASFGSSFDDLSTINPLEKTTQVQNNLTRSLGAHVVKFGGGFNFIDDYKRQTVSSQYVFPSIAAYVSARNGTNPRAYTNYSESFGDPEVFYKSTYWNFFVQDDWKVTRRLKINFGLRYDLYLIPKADEQSPYPDSRKFNLDKNNFAPRLGVVYALREGKRPTVLRFGAGVYYETPWLNMYEGALLRNGNPRFFNFTFTPGSSGAPNFPNTFSGSLPPGVQLTGQNIDAIAPDFVNMYAVHANFQLEQALTENLSLAVGYVHSAGRHLPVYRNTNCLPTGGFLADGRPVFGNITGTGTVVACSNRRFPQFRNIQTVESVGVSRYDGLGVQLTKRFSRGVQFSAAYTLSKATDDAPDNLLEGLFSSDPTNRALDKSYSTSDRRHVFAASLVARPQFNFANRMLKYLFNHNRFGVIATANSGERFNINADFDLNRDGIATSDRAIGVPRNAGQTPPQYNLDLRYARLFKFTERYELEVYCEFFNLFNINRIVGYNDVSVRDITNPFTGELTAPLPDFRLRNQSVSQESRQFQLGVKFVF